MELELDFLDKKKKTGKKPKVVLYHYASDLFNELNDLGVINRMKEIMQLGSVKIPKKLQNSRYQYVLLQLYLHKLVQVEMNSKLYLSYNNLVKEKKLLEHINFQDPNHGKIPTIGDIIQLLVIIFNVGHFYNTFTSSKASISLCQTDTGFKHSLLNSIPDDCRDKAEVLLQKHDYHHYHLINSLVVLEKCSTSNPSIILAKNIVKIYMEEEDLVPENKLSYVIQLFRVIRNISYLAYDLHASPVPISLDLTDSKAIIYLCSELLSFYNNCLPASQMITSLQKLLSDTLYNEGSTAIVQHSISKKMKRYAESLDWSNTDYYIEAWQSKDSVFNKPFPHQYDFDQNNILKLTFNENEKDSYERLFSSSEKTDNVRVGFYFRHTRERTLFLSISRNSPYKQKMSMKVLKDTISKLKQIPDIKDSDPRFLLITKFFLYYLFNERNIDIRPTIHQDKCVLCSRGSKNRVKQIEMLLNNGYGNVDARHECEFLRDRLKDDAINDTAITLPGSLVVYENIIAGKNLCEFDCLIIYPNRTTDQVVFLEAKNTTEKPGTAKRCLKKKFQKIGFEYDETKIITVDRDCYYKYSL